MNTHRGQRLEKALRKERTNLRKLARDSGISHGSIYTYFTKEELRWDIIEHIAKYKPGILTEFPDRPVAPKEETDLQEPESPYENKMLKNCLEEKNNWQSKYFALLEEYNNVLRQQRGVKG